MFTPNTLGTRDLFSRATMSSVGQSPTCLAVMNLVLLVTFTNILFSVFYHPLIAEEEHSFRTD